LAIVPVGILPPLFLWHLSLDMSICQNRVCGLCYYAAISMA
jgi:hypothetical protein